MSPDHFSVGFHLLSFPIALHLAEQVCIVIQLCSNIEMVWPYSLLKELEDALIQPLGLNVLSLRMIE